MRPSAAVSTLLFLIASALGGIVGFLLVASGNPPILGGLSLGAGVAVGFLLAASVKVVAQWQRMIILRLGKFKTVAEPGARLLIPVLDTALFVEMRVQTVPIAQQQAITKDNVPVVVNGVIFFKVIDAESAAVFRTDDSYTYVVMPLSRDR